MSLLELLKDAYAAQKNFQDKNFISLKAARRIITRDRVAEWSKSHPLCLEHGHECPQKIELIRRITRNNVFVFVVLVFAELEFLSKRLIASDSSDLVLFDTKIFERVCDSAELSAEQKQELVKCRRFVGVIFRRYRTQDVPEDAILPFLKRESLERYGSYGVLYRLTVPGQHLRDYNDTVVIAEKRIRPMSDPSQDDWERLFREVQTLQKRGDHPNIIPLLASYTLDTIESGHHVKILYLLFPLAEMDLADWMTRPHTPFNLTGLSKQERQAYIYRSIYALVSSISYLHRNVDGKVTAHHDLKPRNILVVNDELKIADFGHSHLRPILEGSSTKGPSGLGTYEYQPPEYWNQDGSRAEVKHGRAFDVWAMGCIMIELATLAVYDWESRSVIEFREQRKKNPSRDRKVPVSVQVDSDVSFHNNMIIVKNWIGLLTDCEGSEQFNIILNIAAGMLAPKPYNRPYMWEIQMDLYQTLKPYDNLIPKLEFDLCVRPRVDDIYKPEILYYTETPLHRAAKKDDRERVIRLWELGWPLYSPDMNGETPGDIIKRSVHVDLRTLEDDVNLMLEAARAGNIGEIRKLFSRGLTPLMVDAQGISALYEATASFQIEMIDCLLESRAEEQVMLRVKMERELPLHTAARVGFVEALERILRYHPDVDAYAEGLRTALCLGVMSGNADVVKLLLKNRAQVLPRRRRDSNVETPLHVAPSDEIMKLLLEADSGHECIERTNEWGMTPLLEAVQHGRVSCFEMLLQHGASIHAVGAGEMNALRYITLYGRHDILRLCIEDFSLEELEHRRYGKTLLEDAEENGHKEVAQLLKSHIRQRRSHGSSFGGAGFIPNLMTKLHIRQRRSGGSSSGDSGVS